MKLLIIGGTQFLGRAIVEDALARGHTLTLFNRGRTNAGLFPSVETIVGDRATDIARLGERHWDAVIDTCGYTPGVVAQSAHYLAQRVGHYTFISTISVYDLAQVGQSTITESAPLATLPEDADPETLTGETYGPLKVLCEREVEAALPGRALISRPGLIVGPHDPTNRFTYWVRRIAQGGEVLAPGTPEHPVQIIDVRDLAAWTLQAIEDGTTGLFNATGPQAPLTMAATLDGIRQALQTKATFTWVPDEVLLAYGVSPFMELPLWLPREMADQMMQVDVSRALQAGLKPRPLRATAEDTYAWVSALAEAPGQAGLARDKEAQILQDWHTRQG